MENHARGTPRAALAALPPLAAQLLSERVRPFYADLDLNQSLHRRVCDIARSSLGAASSVLVLLAALGAVLAPRHAAAALFAAAGGYYYGVASALKYQPPSPGEDQK